MEVFPSQIKVMWCKQHSEECRKTYKAGNDITLKTPADPLNCIWRLQWL